MSVTLMMVKFYVVDGVSYPAAETACGFFGKHGYKSMQACREYGFDNARAKGSMSLGDFLHYLKQIGKSGQGGHREDFTIDPLSHYLRHHGFGVVMTTQEVDLSRSYLVDGLSYLKAEKKAGLINEKGFATMYAVCKAGAFRGRSERGSMTRSDFQERLKALRISL